MWFGCSRGVAVFGSSPPESASVVGLSWDGFEVEFGKCIREKIGKKSERSSLKDSERDLFTSGSP